MSPLVGAMLAGGVILLSPRPQDMWRLAIAAGLAVLAWRAAWEFSVDGVAIRLPADWNPNLHDEALLNIALAVTAVIPPIALALVAMFLFGSTGVSWRGALFAPAWAAGLVLPGLGRGGEWSATSVALAATAMSLSLVLGGVLARIAPLSSPERR